MPRGAFVRVPIDAMGNYPIQPKYERVWRAMEETGVGLRDASVSRVRDRSNRRATPSSTRAQS